MARGLGFAAGAEFVLDADLLAAEERAGTINFVIDFAALFAGDLAADLAADLAVVLTGVFATGLAEAFGTDFAFVLAAGALRVGFNASEPIGPTGTMSLRLGVRPALTVAFFLGSGLRTGSAGFGAPNLRRTGLSPQISSRL